MRLQPRALALCGVVVPITGGFLLRFCALHKLIEAIRMAS